MVTEYLCEIDRPLRSGFVEQDTLSVPPVGPAMGKLFLHKAWPFALREVRNYGFPGLTGDVNPWPELTAFHPEHEARRARVLAAGQIAFDDAVPRDVAVTYMTRTYALGTFSSSGSLAHPFGYGVFHRRGFQFYYRPRPEPEESPMRLGFLAFPNVLKESPDNGVSCASAAGQHRNVALALYRMVPERTHACEVFCPLQAADGREAFCDSTGVLARGQAARGALFVRDGQCYLAFIATARAPLLVEDRDPTPTGYPFHQRESIPVVVLRHHRGTCRSFKAGTAFEGGIAVVLGDEDEYGDFESFRQAVARARLERTTRGGSDVLSLGGIGPALRLRANLASDRNPGFCVSGRPQKPDTLECPLARQSLRGEPLHVGGFRVQSQGKPVTAYSAPDGSGCVVLQPLPVPVDIRIDTPDGSVRIKGMPPGRIEFSLSPARLLVESPAPPRAIRTTGSASRLKCVVRS